MFQESEFFKSFPFIGDWVIVEETVYFKYQWSIQQVQGIHRAEFRDTSLGARPFPSLVALNLKSRKSNLKEAKQ